MEWKSCERKDGYDTCDENNDKSKSLTFTSCRDGEEFTCDSGHCVNDLGYIFSIVYNLLVLYYI